ncbi:MAG: hypothetical protein EXR72_09625 [Myxococcales bacterium]|nr:hypothetical protein [Myxococcales bacterium]
MRGGPGLQRRKETALPPARDGHQSLRRVPRQRRQLRRWQGVRQPPVQDGLQEFQRLQGGRRGASPTRCGMACADVSNDPVNCGMCGKLCDVGQSCCGGKCFDLMADQSHCGMCGIVCGMIKNAIPKCAMGMCTPKCNAGFADCNAMYPDGCEINTSSSMANCGGCGMACAAVMNGTPTCATGMCKIDRCNMPFADCDGDYKTDCEINTALDPKNCGVCSKACPAVDNGAPGCTIGGKCVTVCSPGFADCDTNYNNGCEIELAKNVSHCGKCGTPCKVVANATSACSMSPCAVGVCSGTFLDCNSLFADGCEVSPITDVLHCGGCNKACAGVANPTRPPTAKRSGFRDDQDRIRLGIKILDAMSPLLGGVKTLTAVTAYQSTSGTNNNPVSVANWTVVGGRPLAVTGTVTDSTVKQRNRADLNFFPPSNAAVSGSWIGDGALLLRNALLYGN